MMAERPNICKYLDLPLQHINDRLLASMRRGTTRKRTGALIADIRQRVPGIALRTTLIAGYPGETRREHEELLQWAAAVRFERLGVFEYSHEENTRAFALADDVPAREKKRRTGALLVQQQGISRELNEAMVGRTLRILVDRKEGGVFVGRTDADSPEVDNEVFVKSPRLKIGEFAQVRITGAAEYDLNAEPAA